MPPASKNKLINNEKNNLKSRHMNRIPAADCSTFYSGQMIQSSWAILDKYSGIRTTFYCFGVQVGLDTMGAERDICDARLVMGEINSTNNCKIFKKITTWFVT
jgi:hypothetical protein